MPTATIAGNWKMNTTVAEATDLVASMRGPLEEVPGVDKIVCPPFVSLTAVAEVLRGSEVALGAQNMYHESQGAYTGEVSPEMLAGICRYVIVGHSERRQLFGETDHDINLKVRAAAAAGLRPILCVGEQLPQREEGRAEEVVEAQLRSCLAQVRDAAGLVVAYEPVWAIGTGMAATPEVAQGMMSHLRGALASIYGSGVAGGVPLLYGGSVNPDNVSDFLGLGDVDGALVGGASLSPDSFVEIVRKATPAGS